MKQRNVAHGLSGGVLALTTCLLLLLGGTQVATAGDFVAGVTEEPPVTETPPTEVPSTEAPRETVVPETPPDGGIVPSPTEVDRDGVAPGQVDLVIVTSDGGMLPAGTTACIGQVCQTLSSDATSGFKWRFERMDEGWQEIKVRGAASYDGAVSSVQVMAGRLVTANVEIVRVAPRSEEGGNTPPPAQDGPPREPGSGGGNSGANPPGTQRFAQVTDLPEAGSGSATHSRSLVSLITAASLMFGVAIALRRRGSTSGRVV